MSDPLAGHELGAAIDELEQTPHGQHMIEKRALMAVLRIMGRLLLELGERLVARP